MTLARRALLLLAFVAVLPAAAYAEPYFTAKDLDLVALLPPPVANGSPLDRQEQALVAAAQQAATPERVAQAQRDATETLDVLFGTALGKAIDIKALPATQRLFKRIGETERAVIGPAKETFGRLRPFLSNPGIKALVKPSTSGSYPSGHTTYATVAAIVVGDMVPDKRPALWEKASDYALSRVIAGVHYFEDLDGGRRAGTAIAVALQSRPDYQADFAAAKTELRQYLGLAP